MKRDYKFGDYTGDHHQFFIMDDMGDAHYLSDKEFDQNHFFYVDYFGSHFTYWD